MKKVTIFLLLILLLSLACGNKNELDRDEALTLIKQEKNYPRPLDYDIFCSDPKYAKKALEAGLEEEGLVTIQRSQKLADLSNPLISFTAKAEAYFLPTPDKDKVRNIQKVKLADEDVEEVSNIRTNESGRKAVVEYTTVFKNVTPFSKFTTADFNKTKSNKAYFVLGDEGWKLEKKPDIDFMAIDK